MENQSLDSKNQLEMALKQKDCQISQLLSQLEDKDQELEELQRDSENQSNQLREEVEEGRSQAEQALRDMAKEMQSDFETKFTEYQEHIVMQHKSEVRELIKESSEMFEKVKRGCVRKKHVQLKLDK